MLLPENHKPSNRWRTEQVESERGFRLACQNIPIGADAFTIKGFTIIYEDLLAETNAFSPRENYLDFPLAERPKQISNRKGEKKITPANSAGILQNGLFVSAHAVLIHSVPGYPDRIAVLYLKFTGEICPPV
jgi:hypothetical protein